MQPPAHHVAMMQIECEVINTKLIHIKEDAIPHHMMEAQQMMNNKSGKVEENNDSIDKNNNASIENQKGIPNEQHQHDDIHSYYHNGYNLSVLDTNNEVDNESVKQGENASNSEQPKEGLFDYEIYTNSSNGEYLDDENNLVLNEDESPDSILQRNPLGSL